MGQDREQNPNWDSGLFKKRVHAVTPSNRHFSLSHSRISTPIAWRSFTSAAFQSAATFTRSPRL